MEILRFAKNFQIAVFYPTALIIDALNKRESRALSQEVENVDNTMGLNEMTNDDVFLSIGDDEGEDDIVLIEEEYKSILDEPMDKWTISRKDFKFEKLIGSGAHAQVYLARKLDTNQLYAIKVLDKKELNRKKQVNGTKIERRILVSIPVLIRHRKTSTAPFW